MLYTWVETATLKCSRLCLRTAGEHGSCPRLCYCSKTCGFSMGWIDLPALVTADLASSVALPAESTVHLSPWAQSLWEALGSSATSFISSSLRQESPQVRAACSGRIPEQQWCGPSSSCPQLHIQHQNKDQRQSYTRRLCKPIATGSNINFKKNTWKHRVLCNKHETNQTI